MSIGSRITEWRKARGLTQAKLAERAQLSASTIAMYETNRRSPDEAAVSKLAEALGIPSALLTGGQTRQEAKPATATLEPVAGATSMNAANSAVASATTHIEPAVTAKPVSPAPTKKPHAGQPARTPATPAPSAPAGTVSAPVPSVKKAIDRTPTPVEHTIPAPGVAGTTQLTLTNEEAKIILFLRMNPGSMSFFESYIRSDAKQREQLARTWRLIHDFQKAP